MKTEISRDSHQPHKRYSGVYQQQGRMLTDGDWNELVDILKYHLSDALKDVTGSNENSVGGTPRHRALGIINDAGETFKIQPGHIYANGESAYIFADTNLSYGDQIDFPQPPQASGSYYVYADIWERTVTQLMDERLRDKGLHGADTCTRKQKMVQIKWSPIGVNPEQSLKNPAKGNGKLTLTLLQKSTDPDPCDPCAAQLDVTSKIGNYLFRVEVHNVLGDANDPEEITFKWSSENGAEQYALKDIDGTDIEPPAQFFDKQWTYEFFDETSEKHQGVHHANPLNWLPLRADLVTGNYSKPPAAPNSFVRRWDGFCTIKKNGGTWSVENKFDKDLNGALPFINVVAEQLTIALDARTIDIALDNSFVAGDFWIADVREAQHQANDKLLIDATPNGIEHYYLRLGEVSANVLAANQEADRKYAFPPLTEMTRMFLAGGDGQETMPGNELPQAMQVAVANGEWLVSGVSVRFSIEQGAGELSSTTPFVTTTSPLEIKTNTSGIAQCFWKLDNLEHSQRVKVELLDREGNVLQHPPVYFNANLSTASEVAYTPECQPNTIHTVHTLLSTDSSLPLLGAGAYYTVKNILDALLCKLTAEHIPFNANCINVNTVKDLLNISEQTTVHEVLDKFICEFKATHLPLDKTDPQLCSELANDEQVNTVQDAINILCKRKSSSGCCTITLYPEDNISEKLANIGEGQDAHICITQGEYLVKTSVVIENKGHIIIHGCGYASKVIAPYSESVFVFSQCKSVVVRDITLQSSATGEKGAFEHINGTLNILDVETVTVDSVDLYCPAAGERTASCLTIAYSEPKNKRASARVLHSKLNPGHQQVGLLLLNAGRAQIEDNEIQVRKKSSNNRLKEQLKNTRIRRNLRRILISKIVFRNSPNTEIELPQNSTITIGRFTAHFEMDTNLAKAWNEYINDNPPAESGLYAVKSNPDLLRYLKHSADNILLEQSHPTGKKRVNVDSVGDAASEAISLRDRGRVRTNAFTAWLENMSSFLPAIAKQGIVCAGKTGTDIRIINNTIYGAAQGIHIGHSHNVKEGHKIFFSERIQIKNNHLTNYISSEVFGGRHGIFVGNSQSLDIEGNYMDLKRFPLQLDREIQGIRIIGYLGEMFLIRQNHVHLFNTGIFVWAQNGNDDTRHLWKINDNMLEGASSIVDVSPIQQFVLADNS